MPNHIPRTFIDEVLNRTDLIQLIGQFIPLKKTGRYYLAHCPFHHEKSPSFTVDIAKQFYYCFGCKVHGNALSFLMEHDHLSFLEALTTLAQPLGLELPQGGSATYHTQSYEKYYDIMEKVAEFYQQQLYCLPEAKATQQYCVKRGLTPKICTQFKIGYAPANSHHIEQNFTSELLPDLIALGMLGEKNERVYARFRQRLMIPIRNARGRVIAFGGRAIHAATQPKYLNSPETLIFHKRKECFGLHEALHQREQKTTEILVVEGYLDVIALWQFGITNVVATLGTALSSEQIQLLERHWTKLIFCFDGDLAGEKAAWRALELCLPYLNDGMQVSFLMLPEGEDPDSLIRKLGPGRFQQRIQEAQKLADYMCSQLIKGLDLSDPADAAICTKRAEPLLALLPDNVIKEGLVQRIAHLVGITADRLHKLILEQKTKIKQSADDERGPASPFSYLQPQGQTPQRSKGGRSFQKTHSPLHRALALLLQQPNLVKEVAQPKLFATLKQAEAAIFLELLEILITTPNLSSAALLERCKSSQYYPLLIHILATDILLPEEGLAEEFKGCLRKLELEICEQNIQYFVEQAKEGALTTEQKQELQQLLIQKQQNLQQLD